MAVAFPECKRLASEWEKKIKIKNNGMGKGLRQVMRPPWADSGISSRRRSRPRRLPCPVGKVRATWPPPRGSEGAGGQVGYSRLPPYPEHREAG